MKVKEIPVSLYHSLKLAALSPSELTTPTGNELPVVVSLTAIPSRFSKVHLTIRSILRQNPKPMKIVLWVNENHKELLPQSLRKLESALFEIRFTHLHCSHKKLIHSLKAFPEYPIVTCDDDCLYREEWLNSLYQTHLTNPGFIIAHRIRCIKKDSQNRYLPYKLWKCTGDDNPKALLAIGAEGILYPPHIFPEIVFDEELFLKLAPKADDLWFKAVALANAIYCKPSVNPPKETIPVWGTQKISLKKENVDEDRNRTQWEALVNYFNLSID